MAELEAVVCLKLSQEHYGMNIQRCNILFATLSTFWAAPEALVIYIVVAPEDMLVAQKSLLTWTNLRFVFLDENLVIPGITAHPGRGWYKQQLLKIAISEFISTRFLLTLDPDLICCQTIVDGDLVADGRAVTGWEGKSCHPVWWRSSARALNMDEIADGLAFGVTPNILASEVSLRLIARLNGLTPGSWWEYLLSDALITEHEGWTEYSLYYTFAKSENLVDSFHWNDNGHGGRRLIGRDCVWFESQIGRWDPSPTFSGKSGGYFLVCQSSSLITPLQILDGISSYLPLETMALLRDVTLCDVQAPTKDVS